MRIATALAFGLVAFGVGCRTPMPVVPLPEGDPRPRSLLEAWRAHSASRESLRAVARFAVDAPGSGVGGSDLSLRSKQRVWLARPASLRVEVLGFLDTTVAVLTTDGREYALFQSEDRSFDAGPVYPGLLWDAARLDLEPREAVEIILGAPHPDAELVPGGAFLTGESVGVELVDGEGRLRRVVEFGDDGLLRRLEQRGEDGELVWEARFADYVEIQGAPFAREVGLEGHGGESRAELRLRSVELNPDLSPDIFRLEVPVGAGSLPATGAEGG